MFPPVTEAQLAEAKRLRALGLPYVAIARAIGVADGTAWKMLNRPPPKPKEAKAPPPEPPPPRPSLLAALPLRPIGGSVPHVRNVSQLERNLPQPSRSHMYSTLRTAVLNTSKRRP
jgi:hypothetical protein